MDLPAAMEKENEVNCGSMTTSCVCSLREVCAKQLVVPSNPPSSSSSVQVEADRCRGAQRLSSPQALLVHRAAPGARQIGGHSIASSEIRILVVFLKRVGPCICFLLFCCAAGLKDLWHWIWGSKSRGSQTIYMKCCLSARANYL